MKRRQNHQGAADPLGNAKATEGLQEGGPRDKKRGKKIEDPIKSGEGEENDSDNRMGSVTESPPSQDNVPAVEDTHVQAAMAEYICNFPKHAQEALDSTRRYLGEVSSKSADRTESDWFRSRAEEYWRILEKHQSVHPISALEYCTAGPEFAEGTVVICTSRQARRLLETCTLSVPLMVPRQFNDAPQPQKLLTIDQFRQQLQFRRPVRGNAWIDVQDFSNDDITRKWELDAALEHMEDPKCGPINFLNIRTLRENVVPWELQGLVDYRVLQEASGRAGVGNDNQRGLNFPDSFALWGKQGTWSLPHIDKHGLYTAVLCEEGEKLWFTWSLDGKALEQWANDRERGERYEPTQAGFPILMGNGDLLIQPPGTAHAPASVTNVVMTGYFFWCSRTMNTTARCALLDLKYPDIANEDVQPVLGDKLRHLAHASKLGRLPYNWGKQEDLVEFHRLEPVSSAQQTSLSPSVNLLLVNLSPARIQAEKRTLIHVRGPSDRLPTCAFSP
jgi:hypothetical protein